MALYTVLEEDFADDPILNGRALVEGDGSRFTYGGGALTAAYDSSLPFTDASWALGQTLDGSESLRFTVEFLVSSDGFETLDGTDFSMQVAFGLTNSATSGPDRVFGTADPADDGFDMLTFDYFPNNTNFSEPSLGSTIFGTQQNPGDSMFANFDFNFGPETELQSGLGEAPLPLDTVLTAIVEYDPVTGEMVLTMPGLPINLDNAGGADGLTDTIQTTVTASPFAFDEFSILLFQQSSAVPSTALVADVEFTSFSVESIPEPTAMTLLGLGSLALVRRRKRA